VSPDQIASRPDSHAGLAELVNDIKLMLRRKEKAYGLPLVALFYSIIAGSGQQNSANNLGIGNQGRPTGHHPDDQGLR